MQLCFFEDEKLTTFHPLTLTRPTDDLRIGILTLSEKWKQALHPTKTNRILRPELKGLFEADEISTDENCIWMNSRYLPTEQLVTQVNNLSEGQYLTYGETIIAANVDGGTSRQWLENGEPDFNTLFVLESNDFLSLNNLWDLFQLNGQEIVRDIELLDINTNINGTVSDYAVLEKQENIYIQEGATIEAGCVLNASKGPIFIGENATIMSGAHIRGPVAICENATIKMGAKIYEDTTIGPVCKVGGEVNNSIFHSYSNKGHDGFVGNSIIGQWCNFGADTNTSNLKNNYSSVRIPDWSNSQEIETNQQFFGTVMGDHSKTAINTQLNTGTICGVSCNIFSDDFPPKLIPSFSWVGSNVIQTYRIDKALEAMEAMMARRDISLNEEYKQMMKTIFDTKNHPQ
ncbi:glucose-1-phosphate thymidylyltransferase [Aliifodinibius salipaludis]|uniref:Glucose-1-phosphate thymidylyltransferase n=1 Tax=Fodinibius salipaludis TaxID=2032627 RepID=A0A2A2GB90_9BACT|nr:GlmU family protein [Aliifodinibius salipaludis]PAU94470.1 glucose-1-phosphate thymidylyltransferase [Aliifodinibius salipaludis]